MTDEVRLAVDTLRYCERTGARCGECPSGKDENGIPNCHSMFAIADLIERLCSERDRAEVKLSELLSHVTGGRFSKPTYNITEMKIFIEDYQQSECDVCDDVAQLVRERDAALYDLRHKQLGCDGCKYFLPPSGGRCALPKEERKHSFLCWEWRGPCAENGGGADGT